MERPAQRYFCNKCGYVGNVDLHSGCGYLAYHLAPFEQNYIDQLERELALLKASPASAPELREQVEKLTMERDTEIARNRPLQSLIKSTEETKSFLLKKSEENKEAVKQLDSERQANALLTEELAALAEQNEKMRKVLLRLACLGNGDQYGNSIGNCIAQEALSLPDLASSILNKEEGETK